MRAVVAMMKHETNTFSPVPTKLARFGLGRGGPAYGVDAMAAFRGTNTGFAAFLEICEAARYEIVAPVLSLIVVLTGGNKLMSRVRDRCVPRTPR